MRVWAFCAVSSAAIAVNACGSSTGASSTTPTASHTATASATPSAGPPLVVWTVTSGGSTAIRTLTPTGGSPHTIATIPSNSPILGVGGGKLVYMTSPTALHVVSLASGADASFTTGASGSDTLFGGAVSPDGTKVAYTVATMSSGSSLKVLTVATGASSTVHMYSGGPVPAPVLWTTSTIVATDVVPYSDAGPQAAAGLNPTTGDEIANTSVAGAAGPVYGADGTHVANAIHTPTLGDDGDSQGGPGPQMPFNTLRTFSLGGTPAIVYQKPHHNVNTLAVSTAGTNVLFFNDSSVGGFAGISMSPDFGLFMYASGAPPVQVEKLDGPRWDGAAFAEDSTAFAARHVGSREELTLIAGSHSSPNVVDTVNAGDQPVFVGFSPIS